MDVQRHISHHLTRQVPWQRIFETRTLLNPANYLVCDQLLQNLPLVEAFLCVPGKLTPGLDANHRFRRNIHSEDQQFCLEKNLK